MTKEQKPVSIFKSLVNKVKALFTRTETDDTDASGKVAQINKYQHPFPKPNRKITTNEFGPKHFPKVDRKINTEKYDFTRFKQPKKDKATQTLIRKYLEEHQRQPAGETTGPSASEEHIVKVPDRLNKEAIDPDVFENTIIKKPCPPDNRENIRPFKNDSVKSPSLKK